MISWNRLHVIGSQVHCVPGSLRPRFYVFATFMQLFLELCCKKKCNFFATVFPNFFFQLFATLFAKKKNATFCHLKKRVAKKSCQKSCIRLQQKLQQTCKKLQKKLHTSCEHNEQGTQWTWDTTTCSAWNQLDGQMLQLFINSTIDLSRRRHRSCIQIRSRFSNMFRANMNKWSDNWA